MESKAGALNEKLEELKEQYSKTKYNKKTDKYLLTLRAKMSRLRKEVEAAKKTKKGKGFFVKKLGDATVALVGFPSAGKSTLINAISNTRSKTASYAFTTNEIIPGMMLYNDAHIQILDMPGIIERAHTGVGGGLQVISAAKAADLILIVIDATDWQKLDTILGEFKALNIFLNRRKPDIRIAEDEKRQGINIEVNRSKLTQKEIESVLNGFGIFGANVKINEDLSVEEFMALVSGNCHYVGAIAALNKIDIAADYAKTVAAIKSKYGLETVPISASSNTNLNELKRKIYDNLNIITVYLRNRLDSHSREPLILAKGSTVGAAAQKIHTELRNQLKCAYIDGPSSKFRNQRVGVDHVLMDRDVVTFIKI